jgi:hypothetical protein
MISTIFQPGVHPVNNPLPPDILLGKMVSLITMPERK